MTQASDAPSPFSGAARNAVLLYLATRALALALLAVESPVLILLVYSRLALERFGPVQGLWEYPWPMSALLDLPRQMGATSESAYMAAWIALSLTVDAALAWLLWRAGGRRLTAGFVLWLAVPLALGPLAFTTTDILPAAATAAALIGLSRMRPGSAGALLGLGTVLKLWPIVGTPALALSGSSRERRLAIGALVAVGVTAMAATLAAGGTARLWSPYAWQDARGLHVEAVVALPALWMQYWEGGSSWSVAVSQFNAYEVRGPGVSAAVRAGQIITLVGLAAVAALYVKAFRAPAEARTPALAAELVLVTVLVVILGSKVFSPQFVLWIAAPLAARAAPPGAPGIRVECGLLLAACALTQVVFPFNYSGVTGDFGPQAASAGRASGWVLSALTLRDILLIALATRLAARSWRAAALRPGTR